MYHTLARYSYIKMSSTSNTVVIVEYGDWDVNQIKYMPPRVNDKGGKSISIISTQSSRALAVSSAPLTTWGIRDFCDENGTSDGKYKLELQFPSEQYKTAESDEFLTKMKAFEQKVIDDAVVNSELWWGKKKSRELVEDAFFPFLKYPKDEKKINVDYTKPPSMKPKVPCYNGEWKTRIFDIDYNKVFPSSTNPDATPLDFVPAKSQVICGLKCTGIWIGGKGWGILWQVEQLIVKPRVVQRVDNDTCHLKLSDKDRSSFGAKASVQEEPNLPALTRTASVAPVQLQDTEVPDSDDEAEVEKVVVEEDVPETVEEEAVVEEEPVPVAVPVKKVIKKVAPIVAPVDTEEERAPAAPPTAAVKKVIKKKAV